VCLVITCSPFGSGMTACHQPRPAPTITPGVRLTEAGQAHDLFECSRQDRTSAPRRPFLE
jgi:hypothetical protein